MKSTRTLNARTALFVIIIGVLISFMTIPLTIHQTAKNVVDWFVIVPLDIIFIVSGVYVTHRGVRSFKAANKGRVRRKIQAS